MVSATGVLGAQGVRDSSKGNDIGNEMWENDSILVLSLLYFFDLFLQACFAGFSGLFIVGIAIMGLWEYARVGKTQKFLGFWEWDSQDERRGHSRFVSFWCDSLLSRLCSVLHIPTL